MPEVLGILIEATDKASGVFQKVGGSAENLGGMLGKLGAISFAGLAAGVGAVGAVVASSMATLMDWGGAIDDFGQQFGMAGEQASAWSVAMERVGLSTQEGATQLNFFTKQLAALPEAMDAGKITPFGSALKELGVSATDAQGNLRGFDSLMPEIMDAFAKLPPGVETTNIAMELFGTKGGSKFLDFLSQGSAGLKDATEFAKQFGLSISSDVSGAAEGFEFQMNDLGLAFKGLQVQIGQAVLPYLSQFVGFLIGNVLPAISQFAQQAIPIIVGAFTAFGAFIQANVLPVISDLVGKIQALFASGGQGANFLSGLMGAFQSALPFLQGLVSGLMENLGAFVGWIVGAFVPALVAGFQGVITAALPTLQRLGDWVISTLLPAFQQLGNFVGPILQAGFKALGEFITKEALPALTKLGQWVWSQGIPALGDLAALVSTFLNNALRGMDALWKSIVAAFERAGGFIRDAHTALSNLANALETTIGGAFEWFNDNVLKPFSEALSAIKGFIDAILSGLSQIQGATTGGIHIGGMASGGVIPEGGFAVVGERGPEIAVGGRGGTRIIPNGSIGGGGVTVQLVYAPTISTADSYELQDKLKPFIEDGIRAALGYRSVVTGI